MFDMGFWEVILIFVILLLVLGPERLPGVARQAGLWIAKARRMVSTVKGEVERELELDELKRSLQKQPQVEEFKRLADQVKSINTDIQSLDDTMDLKKPDLKKMDLKKMDAKTSPETVKLSKSEPQSSDATNNPAIK